MKSGAKCILPLTSYLRIASLSDSFRNSLTYLYDRVFLGEIYNNVKKQKAYIFITCSFFIYFTCQPVFIRLLYEKVWINGQKVGGDISTNPTKAKLSIVEDQEGKDQYTGGINWKVPKTDISKYLVDGENTIEIHYNSTMGNALLATGQIEPTQSSWWGYDEGVEAYGPQKAAILPYVLAALTE